MTVVGLAAEVTAAITGLLLRWMPIYVSLPPFAT